MGLVFKKYLAGGGVHVQGTPDGDNGVPVFEIVWHKTYKGVSPMYGRLANLSTRFVNRVNGGSHRVGRLSAQE